MNFRKIAILALLLLFLFEPFSLQKALNTKLAFAQGSIGGAGVSGLKSSEFANYLAEDPSKCESINVEGDQLTPRNCLFLEEPIGGKANWDLFLVNCDKTTNICNYTLYGGGAVPAGSTGPVQAILTEDPSKKYQGAFGLLYSYVGLVYKYMSGIIVAIVVLFVVIGGIQITTAQGDQGKMDEGKSRIQKAIIGLIVWFAASLILYTINPTFFAF